VPSAFLFAALYLSYGTRSVPTTLGPRKSSVRWQRSLRHRTSEELDDVPVALTADDHESSVLTFLN
jgi:hypothetical protein